eukprot:8684852-Pyramimonas_sp.AAC.1
MLRRIVGVRRADHESWDESGRQCMRRVERAMIVREVPDWLEVVDASRWKSRCRVCAKRHGWPSLALR